MAEPFISPLGLTIYWTLVSGFRFVEARRPCGWPLRIRESTYNTSVVLEVQEDTVEALPGLGLADDDGGVDLLSQLRLSLLDGSDNHVTDTTGGQTVQAGTDTLDGNDVEVTGTRVVGAVHDGSAARMLVTTDWKGLISRSRIVVEE